ncbi:NAD(P)/FAD-dependent oxidoreductase [Myceligenerans pegani]|uniref:NAD(P)/FAD-dependent oxidoreductase n=1 Tax=Myceligenerans pegani TaxID=2776917 RepID=A0ABR9N4W1_9MICO|nr:NAD(P)/FAD-dependent oxidoreductase [Myceligenerans sp. TRM 65318]MBE1878690.1 NAD(P)/FAD-dependent oxidoreductase [Myceligenerans sp. TRM 65318]MBE3020961.1 NAD(P)/FAD-dependent oxidoreductase [Myceligenerans sp. TRM 65318]
MSTATAGQRPPRILVVGAGPAGSVTAIALRRELPDAEVTLVDKAAFPRDKTCGDGMGPGARRILESLGLSEVFARFHTPTGVAITGPGGATAAIEDSTIAHGDFRGYVVPRLDLDEALKDAAVAAGARFREGVSFKGIEVSDGVRGVVPGEGAVSPDDPSAPGKLVPDGTTTAVVHLEQHGSTTAEPYDLVVGADGAYSAVRRALGIDRPAKKHTIIATRAYATVKHPDLVLSDTLRFDFIDELLPAYGWVFPLPDDRANVGIGIPVDLLATRSRKLGELFDAYVADLRRRGFDVSDVGEPATHQLPHAGARQAMTARPYPAVLLGDAAATINTLSGEGIFYAMAAGVQLAEHLAAARAAGGADALRGPGALRTLRGFERAFTRRFAHHHRTCGLGQRLMRSSRWARFTIDSVGRDQSAMATVTSMMFDEGSVGLSHVLRAAVRGAFR